MIDLKRFIIGLATAAMAMAAGCGESKDPNSIIGGRRTQILESGGSFPTWSPDGNDIVYVTGGNLYRVAWSGGDPTQLTSLAGSELFPNFNPVAGEREVVFVHKPGSGDNVIYIQNIDGGEATAVYSSPRELKDPSFTSDGSEIVFSESNRKGLCRVPVTGGEPTEISNSDGWAQIIFSKASPHSETVLYIESREGAQNLHRIGVEGGAPEQLTSFTSNEYPVSMILAVAESYDGTKIALSLSKNDPYFRYTLWTMPSSGAITYTQISEVKDEQTGFPAWSPDGGKIAVEMGNYLYVIELD